VTRRIGLEGAWTAVAREADEQAARNPDLSTDLRIVAAARWRLDAAGHSHFPRTGRDSLRVVLGKVDKGTGELLPITDRSSALCLRLPQGSNDAGGGTRMHSRCPIA